MSDVAANGLESPDPSAQGAAPREAPSTPAAVQGTAPATTVRIWCAFALALCVGMLGLGAFLTPSPDGMGKHSGLFGMPPCGWYLATGYPCPTCGCTTAVAHFAHGHLLTALLTQPFGFFVAVMAVLIIPFAATGLVTGKWRGPSMFFLAWYWRYWVWGGLAILLFGWIFKIIMVKTGH